MDRPLQALNIESNIAVEVDTENRSFAYNMHYNGIAIDGTFKDGEEDVVIQKSFGSFNIVQREPQVKIIAPIIAIHQKSRGGNQKSRGGSQKDRGGAAYEKVRATIFDINTSKPITEISNSEFVDIIIKDKEGATLRSLSVSFLTGAQIGSIQPSKWDGA